MQLVDYVKIYTELRYLRHFWYRHPPCHRQQNVTTAGDMCVTFRFCYFRVYRQKPRSNSYCQKYDGVTEPDRECQYSEYNASTTEELGIRHVPRYRCFEVWNCWFPE